MHAILKFIAAFTVQGPVLSARDPRWPGFWEVNWGWEIEEFFKVLFPYLQLVLCLAEYLSIFVPHWPYNAGVGGGRAVRHPPLPGGRAQDLPS